MNQTEEPQSEIVPQAPAPAEAPVEARQSRCGFLLPYILLSIFVLTLLPGPLFFVSLLLPAPMKTAQTVVIPRGASVQTMAQMLDEKGVLIHPFLFRTMARFMAEDKLKAGEYAFQPGQSVIDVVGMMRDGKTVLRLFTVAEGLTSQDVVTALNDVPVLTGTIEKTPAEGSLLPETYRYSYGDTRQSLIERMQKSQAEAMETLWPTKDADVALTSRAQLLVLASVVEKETGKKGEERARVAGVFLNRLRMGMPLQSDPTVIYALTKGRAPLGRSLTKADLALDSPYNTYVRQGLPPGPICNPGRAAIEAVLHPEKTDFVYFVADGTGGHAFAKTLDEHNKNVARWLSLSRP